MTKLYGEPARLLLELLHDEAALTAAARLIAPHPVHGSQAGSRSDSGANADLVQQTLARIVWARLIEPGDAVAGALIQASDPATALRGAMRDAQAVPRIEEILQRTDASFSPGMLTRAVERWQLRASHADTLRDIARAESTGLRVLVPEHPGWPKRLHDLGPHMPVLLWVLGNPSAIALPSLAVVGARACSNYGGEVTAQFTEALCGLGFGVISGAAYGVDAVAHRTALATDTPTVAVLAGGADVCYPAAHTGLLQRIAAAGAVCAESVPGTAPTRWRFLQRNRLIAALSGAVLVTEAGTRSGSINTAGHAAELGRPLGAVPGPVTSAASSGCHRLIREYGASLIGTTDDLIELTAEIAPSAAEPGRTDRQPGTPERSGEDRQLSVHRRVLDALPLRGGRDVEAVARHAGLTLPEAHHALAELELLGEVTAREAPGSPQQRWALLRK